MIATYRRREPVRPGLFVRCASPVLAGAAVLTMGVASVVAAPNAGAEGPDRWPHVPATAASISAEFPDMVPETRDEPGYHEARCWTTEPESAPEPAEDEPDFGDWQAQWRCYGGNDNEDPFYRFYVYESAEDAEDVIDSLSATADIDVRRNNGKVHTNYVFDDGPFLVTRFAVADRGQFLMFTDGVAGDIDPVIDWWEKAPLD